MIALSCIRVGARLGLGFGLLLVLQIVMTVIGLGRMALLNENLERIVSHDSAKKETINIMRDAVRFQAVALRDVVLQEDLAFKRTELKLMKEARKTYQDAAEALERLPQGAALKTVLTEVRALEGEVQPVVEQVLEHSLADSHVEAAGVVRDKLRPVQIALLDKLEAAIKQVDHESKESVAAAQQAYHSARTLTLLLAGLTLVLGVGAAYLITRSITEPLVGAVRHAQRIAGGDLSGRLAVTGSDETAQLGAVINSMTGQLAQLIQQVKQSSQVVAVSAGEVSSQVGLITERVDVQSEKVIGMSSALEQLTVAISEVASGAAGVAEAADRARGTAASGAESMARNFAVSQAVAANVQASAATIGELSREINRINEVARVIREIADQTNLLALNANIEAARAGEQGRGFAVVADEVRKLAERTTASTADIAAIVESVGAKTRAAVSSMDHVSEEARLGAGSLEEMRRLLDDIVVAADKVVGVAQAIAAATSEQQGAANQTAVGMEHIANLTEENTATIHGIGASATRLAATAEELTRAVGQFRLD